MLEFVEELSGWYDQVRCLPRPTLLEAHAHGNAGREARRLSFFEYRFQIFLKERTEAECEVVEQTLTGPTLVTHVDLGAGRFMFTMHTAHPRWGEMYDQGGEFTARNVEAES